MSLQAYRRVSRILRRQQLALQEARLDLVPAVLELDRQLEEQRAASEIARAWVSRFKDSPASGERLDASLYDLIGRAVDAALGRLAERSEPVRAAQAELAKAQERVNAARTRVDRAGDRATVLRSEWVAESQRRALSEAEEIHLGRHGGSWG